MDSFPEDAAATVTRTDAARQLFQVLETGDPELAHRVVHPDFHNREAAVAPSACSVPGPAGVLASSAWMRSAFSELHFEVLEVGYEQDRAWLRLRMQGQHTGAFIRYRDGELDQAIPATGRAIDVEQIHLLLLRDGQVVDHQAVRDDVSMLAQLGVFPPSPAVAPRLLWWKVSGQAARAASAVSAAAQTASTGTAARA